MKKFDQNVMTNGEVEKLSPEMIQERQEAINAMEELNQPHSSKDVANLIMEAIDDDPNILNELNLLLRNRKINKLKNNLDV